MSEEIVTNRNDEAVTTSICVAQMFDKQHKHVIRDIENLIANMLTTSSAHENKNTLAHESNEPNFEPIKKGKENGALVCESNEPNFGFIKKYFIKGYYTDARHRRKPMYYMTRDGFTLLAMGFTGKRAMEWKIKYITAFNEMEKFIQTIKVDKQLQQSSMCFLHDNLQMPSAKDYQKANTIANKAVSNLYGYEKMVKKSEMTEDMLKDREPILKDVCEVMAFNERFNLGVSVAETIYNKYRQPVAE